jgi:hypothetical protein
MEAMAIALDALDELLRCVPGTEALAFNFFPELAVSTQAGSPSFSI